MLDLLYARAGQDIRGELLERMGKSPARRRLLIVPEQNSHETERAMCAALGDVIRPAGERPSRRSADRPSASMECEVLSFTRLAGRPRPRRRR